MTRENDTVAPLSGQTITDQNGFSQIFFEQPGLTKREYFAALALQGGLASDVSDQYTIEKHCEIAVKCADQLIAELNKQPNQ